MNKKLSEAIELYHANKYGEAEKIFKNQILVHPKELKSYIYLASINILNHKPDAALSILNNALKIGQSAELLNMLGDAHKVKSNYKEAVSSYKKSFEKYKSKESLIKLGHLYYENRNYSEAIIQYKMAIAIDHHYIDALNNLAICYHDLKQYDQAIITYKKIISINENIGNVHANLANTLRIISKHTDALKHIEKALEIEPSNAIYLLNKGNIFKDLKETEKAIFYYDKALEIEPNFPEALNNKGSALTDSNKFNEALELFTKSLQINHNNYEAINNLANLYSKINKYENALGLYLEALKIKNNDPDIFNNLGLIYYELNKYEDSIVAYNKAIELNSDHFEAYNNRGNSYKEITNFEQALRDVDTSIHIKNDFAFGYVNKGNVLGEIGKIKEAIDSYKTAIEIDPKCIEAQFNLGILQLSLKDMITGFHNYELRRKKTKPTFTFSKDIPYLEHLSDLNGKKILLIPEQGIGDTIQFCRYIPLLQERGAEVTFCCPKNLINLFKYFIYDLKVIGDADITNNYDYYCSLLSLPYIFNTKFNNIPSAVKYFNVDPIKVKTWQSVFKKSTFKIGIAWQGSKNKIDLGRSIPIEYFKTLSEFKNVELISLQKGEEISRLENNPVNFDIHFIDQFDEGDNAFLDTAAIMECCDLIITSDTSIAHLAGSIGKRTWLGLKLVPDWRWFLDEETTPWYPSMRLFRQSTWGDWQEVMNKMADALQNDFNLERKDDPMNENVTPFVPCSWGEIIDKITILELKSQHIIDQEKQKHIATELQMLISVASKILLNDVQIWTLKDALFAVNQNLWNIEDQIRIKEKNKEFDQEFIELARSVYINNDQRAKVKNDINIYLKSEIFEVKSYSEYNN